MDDQERHDGPEPELPEALADELRAMRGTRLFIPAEVDEAVLSQARRHLARRARIHRWRRVGIGAAAAAMIAAAAWIVPLTRTLDTSPSGPANAVAIDGDFDGSGTLDILDALALAHRLERGGADGAADVNGDGVIDRRDVEALAMRVVALDGEAG